MVRRKSTRIAASRSPRKQTGKQTLTGMLADGKRKAKAPGWRRVHNKKTGKYTWYYEARRNRSDAPAGKKTTTRGKKGKKSSR